MGCCDDKNSVRGKGSRKVNPTELLEYIGPRNGPFVVIGGVTRASYFVPGPGELVKVYKTQETGVAAADRKWFLAVDGGKAYKIFEPPAHVPELIAVDIAEADE